jgi:hypothetical protein
MNFKKRREKRERRRKKDHRSLTITPLWTHILPLERSHCDGSNITTNNGIKHSKRLHMPLESDNLFPHTSAKLACPSFSVPKIVFDFKFDP